MVALPPSRRLRGRLASRGAEGPRRRCRRHVDAGFTMVEVLIALLLLTIVLSGTMALQVTSIRSARDSRVATTASMLARGRLERFRSLPFAKIAQLTAETVCHQFNGATMNPCTASAFFTQTTNVVVSNGGYQASVTVSWKTGFGAQQLTMTMERQP